MPETFMEADVVSALLKLSEANEENSKSLQSNSQDLSPPTSDEEYDADAPIFTSFLYHGTEDTMKNLTNFTKSEIFGICNAVEYIIEAELYCESGKKSKTNPLDQFFMILCVLNNGGSCLYHSEILKLPSSTFKRMTIKMFSASEKLLYPILVKKLRDTMNMGYLKKENERSTYFPKILVRHGRHLP